MPVEDEISQTEVGVYHNLILENFIEIHAICLGLFI